MLTTDLQRAEVAKGEKFWVSLVHTDPAGRKTTMGLGPFKASEAIRQKEILQGMLDMEGGAK